MRFSGPWFTIGFSVAYPIVLVLDLPLFVYYPMSGGFELTETSKQSGPAMHWYGLLASAAIVGLVAGWIGRNEWLAPRWIAWSVLAPLLAMAVVTWEMRVFFG